MIAQAKKYRKLPVVIEAYQTTERVEIETLEGTMVAEPGDYIITGVKGEQYPCKPDIFEATYEDANVCASTDMPLGKPLTDQERARLEKDFTYHPPKGDQADRYGLIRQIAKEVAIEIMQMTPASREQSLALTKIEEAVFWANAAIARNEE